MINGTEGWVSPSSQRGSTAVRAVLSPGYVVIAMTAQTSRLREPPSLALQHVGFPYASIIIVVHNNYRCIMSALKIRVFPSAQIQHLVRI